MTDTTKTVSMADATAYYIEHSKIKSNGVREVLTPAFTERMAAHGVSKDEMKRIQDAIDFETTAAAHVALGDVERKINEATAEELKDEEFRKNLSGIVRLPTPGGSTEVEVRAEKWSNIPFRGEGDGEPERKVNYGVTRTTINTKGRIYKDFHEDARGRIRTALGMTDD